MAEDRVFYCPIHGRVKEKHFKKYERELKGCSYCRQWYFRLPKFRVKRGNES